MYAYAHTPNDTKVITITSIADFRNEISSKTPAGTGTITNLANTFGNMKTPAPFNFTWKPDKYISKTLFTSLKYGDEFTLELRIREVDGKDNVRSHAYFNFYQCKFMKARSRGDGTVKVDASYGLFRRPPE
jgi:hypothetical protein